MIRKTSGKTMERAEELVDQDLLTEVELVDRLVALGLSYEIASDTLQRLINQKRVIVNRHGRLELA